MSTRIFTGFMEARANFVFQSYSSTEELHKKIFASEAGNSFTSIPERLSIDRSTVWRAKKKFNDDAGNHSDCNRSSSPRPARMKAVHCVSAVE